MLVPNPVGSVAVDQPERDRGADERDRHRQEDQRLGDRLAALEAVGEGGEGEADAHPDERDEDDPTGRVPQRAEHALVGEHEACSCRGPRSPRPARP